MTQEELSIRLSMLNAYNFSFYAPRLWLLLLLLANCCFCQSHAQPELTCNVQNYGAVGDGRTLNTPFLQSAINDCSSRAPSSHVYVPPGSYLTGTIFLKSNMTLVLDPQAIILASQHQKDYPLQSSRWYLILAENSENVSITGGGQINGQSSKFVVRFDTRKNVMVSWNSTNSCLGDECRPRLIGFLNSKHIHVWNIILRDPAYWCLHLVRSEFTHIHDVSIFGDFDTPNNDGIDIDGSNDTVIENCHIDTGDDAVCPKSTHGPLYNLSVTNCWIRTKSCALKLGSGSNFDFVNLKFDNITIVDSHRGLGIQLRDAGNVRDVVFSNIVMSTRFYHQSWWGRAEPIYVTACPRDSSTKVGEVQGVEFINVTATSENGIFLAGSSGGELKNVRLVNVDVKLKRSTNYSGGLQDYRPGCQGLVHHRTSSLFMEHTHQLVLENVKLTWEMSERADWELPMEFSPLNVDNISLVNVQIVTDVHDGTLHTYKFCNKEISQSTEQNKYSIPVIEFYV